MPLGLVCILTVPVTLGLVCILTVPVTLGLVSVECACDTGSSEC